jgi:hypothetical protein
MIEKDEGEHQPTSKIVGGVSEFGKGLTISQK